MPLLGIIPLPLGGNDPASIKVFKKDLSEKERDENLQL